MKQILLILAICTLISSCVTEKKARRWAYENKDKLAEWCADCFPVKPVEIRPGIPIVKLDTITEYSTDTVTVNADCPDGTVVPVKCPPNKTIKVRETITIRDSILIRDTAYERVLTDRAEKADMELEKMTDTRDGWRKRFWWALAAALGLGGVLWFRR